jgi:GNAT superfamily N-acetyltransferase
MKKKVTGIHIRPLTPDRLEDFFTFFETVEFKEHPDWSVCYCYSFHFTGPAEQWNKENNRAAVERLVGENRMKGYLAYYQGKPIGWCNANNRLNYRRLTEMYDLVDPGHPKTCAIVCFLVHQDYRRMGITQLLLDRITGDYSALGYEHMEAYPRTGKVNCEELYVGPLELYLKNGFSIVREFEDYSVVRKSL